MAESVKSNVQLEMEVSVRLSRATSLRGWQERGSVIGGRGGLDLVSLGGSSDRIGLAT
ncbi:hypothetical protein PanWU01x14_150980 [Parasponia andersonii]|uniref:Uncharacterized protein n=1 Tax=Parasponia andersonii TaxID=3476 RepID=A0A2P5CI07_PARAD|nr:hypothetical protein PanWU01x14_150980 [Parasponia andersonii]